MASNPSKVMHNIYSLCEQDSVHAFTLLNEQKREYKALLQRIRHSKRKLKKVTGLISTLEFHFRRISRATLSEQPSSLVSTTGKLQDHLMQLSLPDCFFNVCKDQELAMSFLMKAGIIPVTRTCLCKQDMRLECYGYLGYTYKCPSCKKQSTAKDLTFWAKSNLSLDRILLFLFLWVLNLQTRDIACLLDISAGLSAGMARRLRQLTVQNYCERFRKLNGVVEIAERNFVKRKIEIGKSKAREKWVLVLFEREGRRAHLESLKKRTPENVALIVQQYVEKGSVLITDEFANCPDFEDSGYPHYSFTAVDGFVCGNNAHIHTNNTRNTWTWARHDIKTKNRAAKHLQEFLLEWLWRREIKQRCLQNPLTETAELVKEMIELISKHSEESQ